MRKKLLLSVFACVQIVCVQGQTKSVCLVEDELTTMKHDYECPKVTYDDTHIELQSATCIDNALILIKNAEGKVIYREETPILPEKTEIQITTQVANEKATIELYYDDNCVVGRID